MNDIQLLRYKIEYDPETGVMRHKIGPRKGQIAGTVNSHGYITVQVDGKRYQGHRLAWALHYGYWPEIVDHDDRDATNNRIKNLKDTTSEGNAQNRKARRKTKPATKWPLVYYRRKSADHENVN